MQFYHPAALNFPISQFLINGDTIFNISDKTTTLVRNFIKGRQCERALAGKYVDRYTKYQINFDNKLYSFSQGVRLSCFLIFRCSLIRDDQKGF